MGKIRVLVLFCIILSVLAASVFAVRPSGNRTMPAQRVQQQPAADESDSDKDKADETGESEQGDNVPWAGLAADPNTKQEIQKAWQDVDRAAGSESRRATSSSLSDEKIEENLNLIRTSNRQAESELKLLKLIAQAEGATKTLAIIDRLMEQRQANMDEMIDRARKIRNQERLKEQEERRQSLEERRRNKMPARERPSRSDRPGRSERRDDR